LQAIVPKEVVAEGAVAIAAGAPELKSDVPEAEAETADFLVLGAI